MKPTQNAKDRALLVVRTAHWCYRTYGTPSRADVNRITAEAAAYIASGRYPHSSEDAARGHCYCDWCPR